VCTVGFLHTGDVKIFHYQLLGSCVPSVNDLFNKYNNHIILRKRVIALYVADLLRQYRQQQSSKQSNSRAASIARIRSTIAAKHNRRHNVHTTVATGKMRDCGCTELQMG